jgi:SP family sugar:H+ symporter-like MFS transporter
MSNDVSRIESPLTLRGILLCGFAAFGGILFGYDSGYINGVLGMNFFKKEFGHAVDIGVDDSGYNIRTSFDIPTTSTTANMSQMSGRSL